MEEIRLTEGEWERALLSKVSRLGRLEVSYAFEGSYIDVVWLDRIQTERTEDGYWHAHTSAEIHYIKRGSRVVQFQDSVVTVHAGQALLIGPGMRHRLVGTLGEELRYVTSFLLQPSAQDQEMSALGGALQAERWMVFLVSEELDQLFDRCVREAEERRMGFHSAVKAYLLSILIQTARLCEAGKQVHYKVPLNRDLEDKRMEEIVRYITEHTGEEIYISNIAAHLFLCEKQVQRIVSQQMGTSVHGLIMQIRHNQAKEYLKRSDMSMAQISNALGFKSVQYFCRFFNRMEGMPPGRYRKSIAFPEQTGRLE